MLEHVKKANTQHLIVHEEPIQCQLYLPSKSIVLNSSAIPVALPNYWPLKLALLLLFPRILVYDLAFRIYIVEGKRIALDADDGKAWDALGKQSMFIRSARS